MAAAPNVSADPKWRRRAEARPTEILDAALAVFTEKGFEAARVDEVAARAGLSKGAIYLYFDGKEALLRGLIEREVAPVAERLKALAGSGGEDPEATLRLLVTTAAQVLGEPGVFAVPKLVLSSAPRFREIADYYRNCVVDEALGAIAALHRRGVAAGVFRNADSDMAARLVMGPLLLGAMRTHILGAVDTISPLARAEAHLDFLFKAFAAR